jgi:hypothetical protein
MVFQHLLLVQLNHLLGNLVQLALLALELGPLVYIPGFFITRAVGCELE